MFIILIKTNVGSLVRGLIIATHSLLLFFLNNGIPEATVLLTSERDYIMFTNTSVRRQKLVYHFDNYVSVFTNELVAFLIRRDRGVTDKWVFSGYPMSN